MKKYILLIISVLSISTLCAQQDVVYHLFEDSTQVYAFASDGRKIEGFMSSDTHFRAFTGKRLSEYKISLFDAFTNEPLDYILPATNPDKTSFPTTFNRFSDSSLVTVSDASEAPKGKFEVDLLMPDMLSSNEVLFKKISEIIDKDKELTHADMQAVFMNASEKFKNQYLKSNKELYAQYGNECFACNWEKKFMLTPLFFNNRYISLNISEYAYTGGAHGMLQNTIVNIDKESGEILALEDLMPGGSEKKLSEIITYHVAKKMGLDESTSLRKAGFFNKTLPPASNFVVTPYGLLFVYNPYEVAPYSMGIITVFIPEKELKDVLIKKL